MDAPRFERATPVLPSADYLRARRFYQDVLGFRISEEAGDPAGFGIFERDGCVVFVDAFRGVPRPDAETGDHGWTAHFRIRGLDAFAREITQRGVELARAISTTNYGMRELEVLDPDGNRLCFGEDLDAPPGIIRNHYVLAVPELERTRAWFESAFACTAEDVDAGNWLFLRPAGCQVTFMIGRCPGAIAPADLGDHSYFAYLVVDDVDAWAARARQAGAEVTKATRDESWGMRELGLRTVDGHRIMLGQPI